MQTTASKIVAFIDAVMQRLMDGSTEERFTRSFDDYDAAMNALASKVSCGGKRINCIDLQRMCRFGYTQAQSIMQELVELKAVQKLDSDTEEYMQGDRIILI